MKQTPQICDPITAPFEDFDFVVEAFDKTARLTADEVVRDLIHPALQVEKLAAIAHCRDVANCRGDSQKIWI